MKASYVEGLATYGDPESCVRIREGAGEALPEPSSELVSHVSPDRELASSPAHLPPVLGPASDRHDPRQEPYAVIPLVRICGGGIGRLAFLLRSIQNWENAGGAQYAATHSLSSAAPV